MSVTVIIPTTCEAHRAASLLRAVRSVAVQLPSQGCVLVVANGERVHAETLRAVSTVPGVCIAQLAEGNVARAQQAGRRSVHTQFFCFLDDDDEYLPGAIGVRLALLRTDAAIDVVVTNGYTEDEGGERPVVANPREVRADPLRALLTVNWLSSCAGMFRSATVGEDFFDGRSRFFEWTLIAYRLASSRTVRFEDVFTHRIHSSRNSASKSTPYVAALPAVLREIATLDLPQDVRRAIRERISDAEHAVSTRYLEEGERTLAIRHHLRSLLGPGGVRFLSYSRKLITGPSKRAIQG